jgi:hypothetical protein
VGLAEDTIKAFHSDYDIDRFPAAATAARAAVGLGVAMVLAACWATAGPGNWAGGTWAGADVAGAVLPTVTVVGHRGDAQSVASVSCPRGA